MIGVGYEAGWIPTADLDAFWEIILLLLPEIDARFPGRPTTVLSKFLVA
jgi:hypothetical protein